MNKLPFLAVALLLAACTTEEPAPSTHPDEPSPSGPTNRIDIPAAVVQNLGIKFAKVERRRVDRTLRIPGAFEVPPEAERVYRMPVGGRVKLLVGQYARVQAGDAIASIDSPQWREMQSELDALESELADRRAELVQAQAERKQAEDVLGFYPERITAFDPQLKALTARRQTLEKARDLRLARITELENLGTGARASDLAEARAAAAAAEADLGAEDVARAELERAKAELQIEQKLALVTQPALVAAESAAEFKVSAAERTFTLRLKSAASALGMGPDELRDDAWRALDTISVRAGAAGVVLALDVREGELLEAGELLCHVLDDKRLRFRARSLQSDLGKLRDGLSARVIPPAGGTLDQAEHAGGIITLAPTADAGSRLVDVVMAIEKAPAWARPGVSAELEVVWDPAAEEMLAIPNRALIRDGLEVLFFVRDPANPDKVIRTVAETGPTDGRWTVVYQGVMEGSEVVTDGTYELKLTGGGKSAVKGHFHADGTFHAEGTPEPGGGH